MRATPLIVLCALVAAGCGGADAPEDPAPAAAAIGNRVAERLDALDAITSLYARHLPTGREIAIRADRPMNTLSVIKIPIMIQAYRDEGAGRLDLDERRSVLPEDMRRGSGLLQTFQPGLQPTIRGLVTQMIITSDNTATDMMIDIVGMARVNDFLRDAGYAETGLRMSTGDLFREVWVRADPANAALPDREVFERGFPSDPGASARSFALEGDSTAWLGRTTAREMGTLIEQLYAGRFADEEATGEMVRILGRQFYSSRLPRRVRWEGVSVAHKTGDWPPIAGNDVGILFHEGGPTVISVFTNQNTGDFDGLERTLGEVALDIVRAWGG